MKNIQQFITFSLLALLLTQCKSLQTAPFDQYVYQKTVEIKVLSESLIDASTTPYNDHIQEIGKLLNDLKIITEYEQNRPNNEITTAMWKLLTDTEKHLLLGFFKRWQEKGQLSAVFAQEAKEQITQAFELLMQYELAKDKASEENLLNFINVNYEHGF